MQTSKIWTPFARREHHRLTLLQVLHTTAFFYHDVRQKFSCDDAIFSGNDERVLQLYWYTAGLQLLSQRTTQRGRPAHTLYNSSVVVHQLIHTWRDKGAHSSKYKGSFFFFWSCFLTIVVRNILIRVSAYVSTLPDSPPPSQVWLECH